MAERGGIRTGLEEKKNTSKPSFFVCVSVALKPFFLLPLQVIIIMLIRQQQGSTLILPNVIFHTPPEPLRYLTEETLVSGFNSPLFLYKASAERGAESALLWSSDEMRVSWDSCERNGITFALRTLQKTFGVGTLMC